MEFKQFTYFSIVFALALLPLIPVLFKQANLRSKIKYVVPAILFSCSIFIIWDIRFTEIGIWSFNPDYITGVSLWNLPIEEWLFFVILSFDFFVVYEWVKIKFSQFEKPNLFLSISLVLLAIFALVAFFSRQKLYTFFTFFLLTVYFGYTIFRNSFKKHYTKFYITYLICLIPLLIIKQILTVLPAVRYNNSHIFGVRIFSVPIEDLGYFFLLMLMNITIFEYLNERRFY